MSIKNRLEKLEKQSAPTDAQQIICEWNYDTREDFEAAVKVAESNNPSGNIISIRLEYDR